MNNFFLAILSLFILTTFVVKAQVPLVDMETPAGTLPINQYIGTRWKLDFSDEFNGPSIAGNKWNQDHYDRGSKPAIGIEKWRWNKNNLALRDGKLILKVTKPTDAQMDCASVHTANKYKLQYGYVEARIKIADSFKGTHTALWLQGHGQKLVDGTCNDGAEIDILESTELNDQTRLALYWDGYDPGVGQHKAISYKTPGIHNDEFHTYGFLWTANVMKVFYDGQLAYQVSQNTPCEFVTTQHIVRSDVFLWLSNGASWLQAAADVARITFSSSPIGFLTEAQVDYIRVWKSSDTDNIVQNGDFNETGYANGLATQPWQGTDMIPGGAVFEYGVNSITEPSIRFSGAGATQRYIYQDIAVKPGKKYHVSMNGRIQNAYGPEGGSNSGNHKLLLEVDGPVGNLLTISTTSNMNTLIEDKFVVPAGVYAVRLRINKMSGIAIADNVRMVQVKELTYPSLRMEGETKTLHITKLDEKTLVTITLPDGTSETLINSNFKTSFSLQNKPKGRYMIAFSGATQTKTVILNTNSLPK